MPSSEEFQRVFDLYQKTGVPKGISIVSFCQQHGIVYSQFDRWYKSHRTKVSSEVARVRLVDGSDKSSVASESSDSAADENASCLRFHLSVRTNDGLSVQQNNLTYHQLLRLVEKLEAIC